MTEPLTDQQLAAIDADMALAHEGKLIGVPRGAERFEAAVRVADYHARTLLAEVHRLRAELEQARADRDRLLAFADWTARNTYPLTEVHTAALTAIDSPSSRAALADLAEVAVEVAAATGDAPVPPWLVTYTGAPADPCRAEPVHQTGCPANPTRPACPVCQNDPAGCNCFGKTPAAGGDRP